MTFLEWILNKFRVVREEESVWEPEPLRIEDVYPDNEYPIEDDEDDENGNKVIIIDL
tara:strand:- start:255 stop:425 length:171 start_codon:yes stop_codon:yes gene_type:complete